MADFVEIYIDAGSTFSTDVTVNDAFGTPINLSDYEARAQIRKSYYSTTAIDFVVVKSDASAGILNMSISAANTANIRPGRYVYDVELEDTANNVITRIFEGIAVVSPGVTR